MSPIVRNSQFLHAFVVFALVASSIVAIPSTAYACEDCWPYYEVLNFKPSNWTAVGYEGGDVVWIDAVWTPNGYSNRHWYVLPEGDPDWWVQPDPCCWQGPWIITEEGALYPLY